MAERSLRSIIAELHDHDHTMPLREIARRAGCNQNYVSFTLSQLGRRVGRPGVVDKPEKKLPEHQMFKPREAKPFRNEHCCFVWVDGGKLNRCFAPTNGHTYCGDCLSEMGQRHAGSRFANVRTSSRYSVI